MVSGLVTSPCDQLRMTSGEARRIRIELKAARRRCSRSSMRLNPSFPVVMPSGDWSSVSKLIGSPLNRGSRGPPVCERRRSGFLELHFETQALELLDQHVEGFGHARLR